MIHLMFFYNDFQNSTSIGFNLNLYYNVKFYKSLKAAMTEFYFTGFVRTVCVTS